VSDAQPDGVGAAAALAHDRAVAEGQAGYLDPETGLFVLTAVYLRERASCCGQGCRHCPYDGGVAFG
jgi:Family of unknown function (DUF5522)